MKSRVIRPELSWPAWCALLVAGVLLLGNSRLAFAKSSGINLSWDDCGAAGELNKSFACDTNSGSETLIASAAFPDSFPALWGVESVIEIQADASNLPPWWTVGTSASFCRRNSLTGAYSDGLALGPCSPLPFTSAAVTSIVFTSSWGGLNRARVYVLVQQPEAYFATGKAGVEYHVSRLSLSHAKTTGAGNCAGCAVPVCINLRSVTLTTNATQPPVTTPLTRAHVTWQGASDATCVGATPARSSTWGAIKALYR